MDVAPANTPLAVLLTGTVFSGAVEMVWFDCCVFGVFSISSCNLSRSEPDPAVTG